MLSLCLSVAVCLAANSCLGLTADCPPTDSSGTIAEHEARCRANPSAETIDATVEGCVIRRYFNFFILKDSTGDSWVFVDPDRAVREGDRVRCKGKASLNKVNDRVFFMAGEVLVTAHGAPSPPVPATLGDVAFGERDLQPCAVEGIVTEIERDEIDAQFLRLTLEDGSARLVTLIYSTNAVETASAKDFLDRRVRVTGIGYPPDTLHRAPGSYLLTDSVSRFSPLVEDAARLGKPPHRVHASGRVIACWQRAFFLQTAEGKRLRVYLDDSSPMPRPNDSVTVLGFRRYYPFFPRLMSSVVRPGPADLPPVIPPIPFSAQQVLFDGRQQPALNRHTDGRLVSLLGTVREVTRTKNESPGLTLETDGFHVPALLNGLPPPPVGTKIRLTGACLLSVRGDETDLSGVHLKGFSLVPRTAADIVILEAPPWWTLPRLLTLLAVLSAIALLSLIGNVLLRRLVERRGHQLAEAELSGARSELKKTERTRLAVELHDSLSQNLTGIVLQLDASRHARESDPVASERHLETALHMLQGCRTELRRCITDLRSSVLDLPDFEEAIRISLHPVIGTTNLHVRSHIPRARLGDDVAHAVLRIVRELVANAIRHGRATAVRVAGDVSTGPLKFSVSDDGCGFPPGPTPGPEEGHYGLTGIRERLRELNGSVSFESVKPHGTKITFIIPTPNGTP